jgi:hypothetical protein
LDNLSVPVIGFGNCDDRRKPLTHLFDFFQKKPKKLGFLRISKI